MKTCRFCDAHMTFDWQAVKLDLSSANQIPQSCHLIGRDWQGTKCPFIEHAWNITSVTGIELIDVVMILDKLVLMINIPDTI